ncbi:MAG TPA: PilZ domain-containing protein [Pseudolabrys sp.]|jgi:hypothetical protein
MDHHDKRARARRAITSTAHIATGVSQPIACRLKDVSELGARLVVNDPHTTPQQFLLVLGPKISRWCEVMWRSDVEVGLKFTPAPRTVKLKKAASMPPDLAGPENADVA